MGMELEWKYAADRAALDALRQQTGDGWRRIEMESRYYDVGGELAKRRWTLRLRRENGESVICLKTPGDGRARGEWEWRGPSVENAAEPLISLGAPEELRALLGRQAPEIVCGARFVRWARNVDLPGAAAELALDEGVLTGGGKRAPLCEIEVEHKAGDPAASQEYAESLARRLGLRLETRSKFQRALALRD